MGEVYDSSTGQVVSAPDVPEEMVTVRNPTSGEFEQHNRQTASSLIAQGWDVDSPELRNEIALQRQYGEGVGNEASAAALGIARGASFGLSDLFSLAAASLIRRPCASSRRETLPRRSVERSPRSQFQPSER